MDARRITAKTLGAAALGVFACLPPVFGCAIEGEYRMSWVKTHGGGPLPELRIALSGVPAQDREVLDGMPAESAADCRWHVQSSRPVSDRYFVKVADIGRAKLDALFASARPALDCYQNDLAVICRNPSGEPLTAVCSRERGTHPLIDPANGIDWLVEHFCSVSGSEREDFEIARRIDVPAAELIGAVGYQGIFRLERIQK